MEDHKDLLMDIEIKNRLKNEIPAVPVNIHTVIKETVDQLPNRKLFFSTGRKAAVAAVLLLSVFTGIGLVMPTYADQIPLIGSIFKILDNGFYSKFDSYSSDINITKESNGVKITVTSIVYDGIDLNVAYKVDTSKPLHNSPHILDKDFKINGKTTTFSSGGNGKFSNNNMTYIGVETFHVSKDYIPKEVQEKTLLGGYVKVPDSFTLEMNVKELLGDIKGNWNFKLPVTNEKVNGKVKEFNCNVDLGNIEKGRKINKVLITPLNTALQGSCTSIGEDDSLNFVVLDDKGRELHSKSGSGTGNDGIVYFENLYKEVYPDTKSLIVIPYKHSTDAYTKKKVGDGIESSPPFITTPLNLNGETTLDLGKYGDLKITRIESANGSTKLYYKSEYGFLIQPLLLEKGSKETIPCSKASEYLESSKEFVLTLDKPIQSKEYIVQCENIEKTIKLFEDSKFTVDITK